ncbi:MAG: GNAT family N-acetyltransferase [Bacillus sp. (in: firmicutes)]
MANSLFYQELLTDHDVRKAFTIIKQLRPHLNECTYLSLVQEARSLEGYKMVALYDKDVMVSVVGFVPRVTLYYGRFIFVCDLVTDSVQRSKGYGGKLLAFVHDWAKEQGYSSVSLTSGLQRTDAHRFYEEKMGYNKLSYAFKKEI